MNKYSSDPAIQGAYEKALFYQKAKDAVVEIACKNEFWLDEAVKLIDFLGEQANKYNSLWHTIEFKQNEVAAQSAHETNKKINSIGTLLARLK